MSAADIQKQIDELNERFITQNGDWQEYQRELEPLLRALRVHQQAETQVEEPTPAIELLSDIDDESTGHAFFHKEKTKQMRELSDTNEFKNNAQGLEEEATKRAIAEYEKKILPKLFTTGEYKDSLPAWTGLSRLIDPVKGLVINPEGAIEKTKDILPFFQRQVVYSPASFEESGPQARKKRRATREVERTKKELQELVPEGAGTSSVVPDLEKIKEIAERRKKAKKEKEEAEEAFKADPQYKKVRMAGGQVETVPAWGMRVGLNTGSAYLATRVAAVQDFLFSDKPKTRKETYKKTEFERPFLGHDIGQFLTNTALNQGMYTQFQAQMLPPEYAEESILHEGSLVTTLLGLAAEIAAPLTPFGIVSDVYKVGKGAYNLGAAIPKSPLKRLGKFDLLSPVKTKVLRNEVDNALRAVGGEPIKKAYTRQSMRSKASQSIGETYAVHRALKEAVAKSDGLEEIRLADVAPESPVANAIFDGSPSLPKAELRAKVERLGRTLEEVAPLGTKELPLLRRALSTSEDVVRGLKGEKIRGDADIIRRNIQAARIETAGTLTDKAKDLIDKSATTPLKSDELIALGKELPTKFEAPFTPRDVYLATRSSVADVMRDNFLRNIPEDFILVSNDVSIPAKFFERRWFRNDPNLVRFREELPKFLEFESKAGQKTFDKDSVERILQYQNVKGFELPPSVVLKMKEGKPLSDIEFSVVENKITGELAIDHLEGIRLRSGKATAEMAQLVGAQRTSLIPATRGASSSALIGAKFLARTLMNLGKSKWTKRLWSNTPSASFNRLSRAFEEAGQSAFRITQERLITATQGLKTHEQRIAAIEGEFEVTFEMGMKQKMFVRDSKATRAGEALDIDEALAAKGSTRQADLRSQEMQKKRAEQRYREALEADRIKVTESFEKKRAKELETLNKRYKARKESLDKSLQKVRDEQRVKLQEKKKSLEKKLQDRFDAKELKAYSVLTKDMEKRKAAIKKSFELEKKRIQEYHLKGLKKISADIKLLEQKISQGKSKVTDVEPVRAKKIQKLQVIVKRRQAKSLAAYKDKLKNIYGNRTKNEIALAEAVEEHKRILREEIKKVESSPKIIALKQRYESLISQYNKSKQKVDKEYQDELLRYSDEVIQSKIEEKFAEKAGKRAEIRADRLSRIEERKVVKAEQAGERAAERAEKIQKQRIKGQLRERFGSKAVEEVLASRGFDESAEVIRAQIADIEAEMQNYVGNVYRAEQWKILINKWYTSVPRDLTEGKTVTSTGLDWAKQEEFIYEAIRNFSNPGTYLDGNILPFTIENYKIIIDRFEERYNSLKDYGLSGWTGRKDYMLPFTEWMTDIQRVENMNDAISRFVRTEPEMLLGLNQAQNNMMGLYDDMAEKLGANILDLVNRAGDIELDPSFVVSSCTEVLFDGIMKDVWTLSGRENQLNFLNLYLRELTKKGSLPTNMDDFFVQLFDKKKLPSNTYEKIEQRVNEIIQQTQKSLDTYGALGPKQIEDIAKIQRKLPEVIETLRGDYLVSLIGSPSTKGGLFSTQMQQLSTYLSKYGVNDDIVSKSLQELDPILEYIGDTNLAILYGDKTKNLVKDFQSYFKSSMFEDRLKSAAVKGSKGHLQQKALQFILGCFSNIRKFQTTNMLTGGTTPITRFFANNTITAPIITAVTLGGGASIKIAKGIGKQLVGGQLEALRKLVGSKSSKLAMENSYLYLPEDRIVVRASEGARRNYTAGELRKITTTSGLEYSRAGIEFYDDQYQQMLIALKIRSDSSARITVKNKDVELLLDQALLNKNIFADYAQIQDASIRRGVFVNALRSGASVREAVILAKKSMLDYGALSKLEKVYFSKYLLFYAFNRSMFFETMNSFYRQLMKGRFEAMAPMTLRAQNSQAQAVSEEYYETTDRQLKAIYNLYAGNVDGVNIYDIGPENPMFSSFEMMSLMGLTIFTGSMEALDPQQLRVEAGLWNFLSAIIDKRLLNASLIRSAFDSFVLTKYPAEYITEDKKYVPDEMVYAAETNGTLDSMIQRYDLVIDFRDKAARPLTLGLQGKAGLRYKFKDDNVGYERYVKDRMIGQCTWPLFSEFIPMFGQHTRAIKDKYKAEMSSRGHEGIDIYGETGDVVERIPTTSKYLKGATSDAEALFDGYVRGLLYRTSIKTPARAKDPDRIIERNLIKALKEIRNLQRQTEEEEDGAQ